MGTTSLPDLYRHSQISRQAILYMHAPAQIRQQAAQQEQTESLDGGKVEGNETSEPVVDAREKLKRSKGKK